MNNVSARVFSTDDRALLDGSADGVVLVGADLRIQAANSRALEMLGVTLDELVGQGVDDLLPRARCSSVNSCLRSMSIGEQLDERIPLKVGGEELRPIDVRACRMADARFMLVLRDLDDLRHQEQTLYRLNRILAESHGTDFLRSLAPTLRDELEVDCAFVAEVEGGSEGRMVLRALASPDRTAHDVTVPLEGTVAQRVLRGRRALRYSAAKRDASHGLPIDESMRAGWMVPLIDSAGEAVGLLGVMSRDDDLNERAFLPALHLMASRATSELSRLRTEAALRRSERHLRAMIQASARFVWSVDADGEATGEAEQTWAKISGQDQAVAAASNSAWLRAVVPEDRARVASEWAEIFAEQREHQLAYRVEAPDGTIRDLQVRGVPVFDDREEFEGFIGTIEDVTPLRRAAEELRRKNQALQVLQSVPEAAYDGADFRECLAVAADESARIWGFALGSAYARDETTGVLVPVTQGAPSRWAPNGRDVPAWAKTSADVRWLSKPDEVIVPVRMKDETVAVLRFDRGSSSVTEASARDVLRQMAMQLARVYERDRDQEQVRLARQRAFEAQKLEAVGRLAGGVAHEFNNRLMVVLGEADLALRQAMPSPAIRESLQAIRASGRRAAEVTKRLLAFSGVEAARRQRVDLCDLLARVADTSHDLVGRNIEIETQLVGCDWDCAIELNPGLLEQAALELIMNAAEAMPDGGRIALSVGREPVDEERATRQGVEPGLFAVVSVTDQGEGIPREHLQSVRDPFFTTKPASSGLGLASACGYVSGIGGFVELESEVGLGTEVRMYFPLHFASVAPQPLATLTR